MHVADQPTCGQGLAQNAVVPAGLAAVAGGLARNLEVHMNALDLDDPPAAEEHAVYERLAALLRRAEGDLDTAAAEMARARDLPMGRHDMAAMTSPEVLDAFERHGAAEEALHALLGERRAALTQMLEQMRRTIGEHAG
jgi:hypothetical protein